MDEKELTFACTACGLCCKKAGEVLDKVSTMDSKDPWINAFKEFPYKTKEDGSCEKLTEDGKCEVYEERPLCCNIDLMYDNFWKKSMKKNEYYKLEVEICNKKIKENNLPEEFLIDEKKYL